MLMSELSGANKKSYKQLMGMISKVTTLRNVATYWSNVKQMKPLTDYFDPDNASFTFMDMPTDPNSIRWLAVLRGLFPTSTFLSTDGKFMGEVSTTGGGSAIRPIEVGAIPNWNPDKKNRAVEIFRMDSPPSNPKESMIWRSFRNVLTADDAFQLAYDEESTPDEISKFLAGLTSSGLATRFGVTMALYRAGFIKSTGYPGAPTDWEPFWEAVAISTIFPPSDWQTVATSRSIENYSKAKTELAGMQGRSIIDTIHQNGLDWIMSTSHSEPFAQLLEASPASNECRIKLL